jgi:Ca2+-binding EF-hand superfamily protein
MLKHQLTLAAATLLALTAQAQVTDESATGNMQFDVRTVDTNHDGMISQDEMKAYTDKMWTAMAKDAPTIPVAQAAQDFASRNLSFSAKTMDADHDGTISKDEFMTYAAHRFNKLKDFNDKATVPDVLRAFELNGNPHVASGPSSTAWE